MTYDNDALAILALEFNLELPTVSQIKPDENGVYPSFDKQMDQFLVGKKTKNTLRGIEQRVYGAVLSSDLM